MSSKVSKCSRINDIAILSPNSAMEAHSKTVSRWEDLSPNKDPSAFLSKS